MSEEPRRIGFCVRCGFDVSYNPGETPSHANVDECLTRMGWLLREINVRLTRLEPPQPEIKMVDDWLLNARTEN